MQNFGHAKEAKIYGTEQKLVVFGIFIAGCKRQNQIQNLINIATIRFASSEVENQDTPKRFFKKCHNY